MPKTTEEIYEEQLVQLASARTNLTKRIEGARDGESAHHSAAGLRDVIEAELQVLALRVSPAREK